MKIAIGNLEFSSIAKAKEFYRELLYRPLTSKDFGPLHSLLEQHPSSRVKVGRGVSKFYTAQTEHGTTCFWVERIDGTHTDWSMRECFGGIKEKEKALGALRYAVRPQIARFRAEVVWPVRCSISGEQLLANTSHIDHVVPFKTLVEEFLKEEELSLSDLKTKEQEDGETSRELEREDITEKWVTFHKTHARLQAISIRANLVKK